MDVRRSVEVQLRRARAAVARRQPSRAAAPQPSTERSLDEPSYSIHGEDVAVLRTLERSGRYRDNGFYVDVGAFHPTWGSNTALFHARGWRGINVEPNPAMASHLAAARPGDVTLPIAVGATRRTAQLNYFYEWASSNTLVPEFAAMISSTQDVRVSERIDVDVVPLAELLHVHVPDGEQVDLLNVDVEGMDLEVLQSNDWERFRPLLVAVEDLDLRLDDPDASEIHGFLHSQGYRLSSHLVLTSLYVSEAVELSVADWRPSSPAVPEPPVPEIVPSIHGTYVGNDRVLVRLRGGGRLLVSSNDLSLMPELVTEGGYDAPFTAFLRRVLTPDATFVDVGANVGLFTVIGALQAWRGRVIAYEPVDEVLDILRDNVQLNWLDARVTVRPVAVADSPGSRQFGYDPRMQMLGGLESPSILDQRTVDVVTLDEDLANIGHVDLLKIDVEGGEASALDGARETLACGRVDRVTCEVRQDALVRMGRDEEWDRLIGSFRSMQDEGWTFALIAPDGTELQRAVDEVATSEPHPNVVARRPGLLGADG